MYKYKQYVNIMCKQYYIYLNTKLSKLAHLICEAVCLLSINVAD